MAERARKGELRLGEFKFTEQADIIRWHSQLGDDGERDGKARGQKAPGAAPDL